MAGRLKQLAWRAEIKLEAPAPCVGCSALCATLGLRGALQSAPQPSANFS